MAKARGAKSKPGDVEAPSYPIESVNNALKLLALLVDRPSIGVTEAAQNLDVAPSTAHRLFQMLRYHELVDQDASIRSYRPGPALLRLGMSTLRRFDLRAVAMPHLSELARAMQETILLGILQAPDILYVECVESSQVIRVGTPRGSTLRAYASTSGRVLLSALRRSQLETLFPKPRIASIRPSRFASKKQLFGILDRIRSEGHDVWVGELADGVASIAVPIIDHSSRTHAAVEAAIPVHRFDADRLPDLLDALRKTSHEIGAEIP